MVLDKQHRNIHKMR